MCIWVVTVLHNFGFMKKTIFTSCAFLLLTSCKTIDNSTSPEQGYSSYSDQARINQQQRDESDWRRRDIEAKRKINELEQKLSREKNENEIRRIQEQINRQHQEEARARQQLEQARQRLRMQELENQRRQQEIQAQELRLQAGVQQQAQMRRQQEEQQRVQAARLQAPIAPQPVAQPNLAMQVQAREAELLRRDALRAQEAEQLRREDALRAQEARELQQAIDRSLVTAEQEERRRQAQQANLPIPAAAPLAPPIVVPVPVPPPAIQPQENVAEVDGRSWYEAGEIVKEYRQAHGGTSPTVAHVIAELQRRLNITAAQAQHVCDEMGLA